MGIFKDKAYEAQFDQQGFVRIREFLDAGRVAAIRALIEQQKIGEGVQNMYSNLESHDRARSQEIGDFLTDQFGDGLEKYFQDYEVVGASFLFKGPGKNSDSRLHQDWNIVDETIDRSLVIWVPLHEVDERNGCLVAVPGSHLWKPTIRSSNIDSIHLKYTPRLDRHIRSIPARAGDAIVYALHTFHGSKPNYSGKLRQSAVVSISNKGAVPVHYVRDGASGKVFKVLGDSDFMYDMFFKLHRGEKTDLQSLKVLGEVDHPNDQTISEQEFYAYLGDRAGGGWKQWFSKFTGR